MRFINQEKIRILLVNDEGADLEHYRDAIEQQCKGVLDVRLFGPDQAASPEVGRTLLKALKGKSKISSEFTDIDVLFIDLRMPDINGFDFLRLLREHPANGPSLQAERLPVVIMTKYESQLLTGIDAGLEKGISGYVFTDRDLFWLDVEATAIRAFQESRREIWAESLMELSTQLTNVNNKNDLCRIIFKVFDEKCPELRVFIREFLPERSVLSLLGSSHNIPDNIKTALQEVAFSAFPMLKSALKGQVYFYNSIHELKDSGIGDHEMSLLNELGLHRGISLPLIDERRTIFGTLSIYRRSIDPSFNPLEKTLTEMMVKQIADTWITLRQKQQGIAYALFFKEFSSCPDEDDLLRKLVNHLHEEINKKGKINSDSKTTFKKLFPGTDRLVCQANKGHHVGVYRDPDFSPSIYSQQSISAWVARENKSRLIPDYSEASDWVTTNPNMRSELCLPVSSTDYASGPVYGVINLESSHRFFYTQSHLEYAEALCRLAGYCIARLRTYSFLHQIISALSAMSTRGALIETSCSIIKEFTGCRILLFVIRDNNKWKIAHIDVTKPDADVNAIVRHLQSRLESEEHLTLLQTAFSQNKPIYYIPDLQTLPEGAYYVPPSAVGKDEALRSQAVFMMKYGENIVGGLSLDFVITNALSKDQQEILGYFAGWLGRLILHDTAYDGLRKRVEDLDQIANFTDFMSQIWHKSTTQLHKLRNIAEECTRDATLERGSILYDNLHKLYVGIEQLKGLPTRMQALAKAPKIQKVDTLEIWEKVKAELAAKATSINADLSAVTPIPPVQGDPQIIEMIIYHLLDNALDACECAITRKIVFKGTMIDKDRVELCISDTGMQVTQHELYQMLQLGYTTKAHGTGYGLYWVKRRVVDMNGTFEIRGKLAEPGLEAIINLPSCREMAAK